MRRPAPFRDRLSGYLVARRAAGRLLGMTDAATIEQDVENVVVELADIVSPLAGAAAHAVLDVVRALVAHPDGPQLAATRVAEALAAKAAIRS